MEAFEETFDIPPPAGGSLLLCSLLTDKQYAGADSEMSPDDLLVKEVENMIESVIGCVLRNKHGCVFDWYAYLIGISPVVSLVARRVIGTKEKVRVIGTKVMARVSGAKANGARVKVRTRRETGHGTEARFFNVDMLVG